MSNTLTTAGFSSRPFTVWMTGKTINATKASRTNITVAPQQGFALVQDPYGWDNLIDNSQAITANVDGGQNTKHIDFTQPQTGFVNQAKALIVGVHAGTADSIIAGTGGGFVDVVTNDQQANVFCNDNIAIGNTLAVINGSYCLGLATVFAATNMATFLTLGAKCATALHTADTSGGTNSSSAISANALLKRVNFNGSGIV